MTGGLRFILWSVCAIFCRVRRMMFLLFFRMRKDEREGSFCSLLMFWAIEGTEKTILRECIGTKIICIKYYEMMRFISFYR